MHGDFKFSNYAYDFWKKNFNSCTIGVSYRVIIKLLLFKKKLGSTCGRKEKRQLIVVVFFSFFKKRKRKGEKIIQISKTLWALTFWAPGNRSSYSSAWATSQSGKSIIGWSMPSVNKQGKQIITFLCEIKLAKKSNSMLQFHEIFKIFF